MILENIKRNTSTNQIFFTSISGCTFWCKSAKIEASKLTNNFLSNQVIF